MGSSQSRLTSQDKAVLELKLQRDKLKQYQKRIQIVLDREQSIAKQCLANNDKSRALLALRKRKYQQQLLSKTDTQLATLEELTHSIEFALVQKDVLYGLEQGNKVLKTLNSEMSMDKVDKILDQSSEGIAYQQEISEMLAGTITNNDEMEVLEEFHRLEKEAGVESNISQPEAIRPETIRPETNRPDTNELDSKQSNLPEMPSVPQEIPQTPEDQIQETKLDKQRILA